MDLVIWDPATRTSTPTANRPTLANGTPVNIFCSGHTFLPDGRLLVVGGHVVDSNGINQACIYDPLRNTWSPTALMNEGRSGWLILRAPRTERICLGALK